MFNIDDPILFTIVFFVFLVLCIGSVIYDYYKGYVTFDTDEVDDSLPS